MTTNGSTHPNFLQTAIDALEQQILVKRAEIAVIENAKRDLEEKLLPVSPGTMPKAYEYGGLGITEAATRFLREVGTTGATTRELLDGMMDRGWTTRSKNAMGTVFATPKGATPRFRKDGDRWYLVN